VNELYALRDPVSAATHFAGFLWAIFGALILWRLVRDDWPKRLSLACFGLSAVLLYAASSTYHLLNWPPALMNMFRQLDHTAIYGLIAGTYTPIFIVLLRGRLRISLLALMWSLAVMGSLWKWMLPNAPYTLTVGVYLAMGWVGLLSVLEITRAVGVRGFAFGILGGCFYTAGALFDMLGWPVLLPGVVGTHELLHICVLAGSGCHFLFMMQCIVPYQKPNGPTFVAPRGQASLLA